MMRSAATTTTTNHNHNIHPKSHSTGMSSSATAAASGVGGGSSSSSWSHHHRGSTPQLPLAQVLTVPPSETLLVTDAVAALCDGRFVLYAVAAAALSSSTPTGSRNNNNSNNTTRVFWMSCTCVTEECIRQALKKLGSNDDNDDDRLYIDSLPTRLIQQAVESTTTTDNNNNNSNNNNSEDDCFQEITFVKELYQRVQAFVTASSSLSPTMVILDDVSALSVLVGEQLTHALIVSLNDLSSKSSSVVTANDDDDGNHHHNHHHISSLQHPFSLVLRCSNDCDIHHVRRRVAPTGRTMEPYDDDGDDDHDDDRHTNTMKNVPWERALVELADTVVDVTSVPSGYSREIAGRLILTRRRRRSSAATTATTTTATTAEVYNVCLTDHQVFVLRLAAT